MMEVLLLQPDVSFCLMLVPRFWFHAASSFLSRCINTALKTTAFCIIGLNFYLHKFLNSFGILQHTAITWNAVKVFAIRRLYFIVTQYFVVS